MNITNPTLPLNGTSNRSLQITIGKTTSRHNQTQILEVVSNADSNLKDRIQIVQLGAQMSLTNVSGYVEDEFLNVKFITNAQYWCVYDNAAGAAAYGPFRTDSTDITNTVLQEESIYIQDASWTENPTEVGSHTYSIRVFDDTSEIDGDYLDKQFTYSISDDDSEQTSYYLNASITEISDSSVGRQYFSTITTNGTAIIERSPSWVTATISGNVINIKLSENSSSNQRSGNVVIGIVEDVTLEAVISITQAGIPSQNSYVFNILSGNINVYYTNNSEGHIQSTGRLGIVFRSNNGNYETLWSNNSYLLDLAAGDDDLVEYQFDDYTLYGSSSNEWKCVGWAYWTSEAPFETSHIDINIMLNGITINSYYDNIVPFYSTTITSANEFNQTNEVQLTGSVNGYNNYLSGSTSYITIE